ELVGRPAGHFNLWLDEADRKTMLAELAARGAVSDHLLRYRHKSGVVRRSLFSAVPIELGGQPALLSLSQDVTPQYESDERFRATLRHAQVVAYSQDLDLRYTWVGNPRPPLVPEVMLGRTDADLLPPERAAPLTALKRQVLDSGVGLRTEITTEWAGRPFVYDLMLEPLRDAAGAVIGLTGVSIDITARRAAEAELARTETLIGIIHAVGARLQASLKVEGIVAALTDGLRQLGLQAAILQLTPDQEALRLAGHTLDAPTVAAAEQVLGRPLSDVLLPASSEGRPAGALRPAPSFFALDASTLPLHDFVTPAQWDQLAAVPGLKLNAPILFKPLVAEEQLLGWLEVCGPDLREADQPAYTVLARYLAIALEHARLVEALQTSQGRLAALSLGLVEVQEAERRAVARELHDEIGQALTGLRLLLENTVTRTDRLELAEARAVLTDLIGRVQALSLDLRPAILDDLGLEPALRWHLQRFQARTGLRVDLSTRGLDRRFDNLVETTAYRIVQEALTNIVRHAGVGQAWVRAWVTAERLGLEITDEGRGFDVPAALAAHLSTGLSAMRERIQLLGGRLEIDAIPGEGTRILAELPLQPAGGPGREA
ncbi:MAG: PAS domain-containing protein, partial [Anaerolineales bacterium]|nr:PAS domain-containing protein [Anaerolineales bacterium]